MGSDQFDALAKVIEASAETPIRKYFEEFTFFNALGHISGRSVLDVACGSGLYTRRFKRRGAGRVVGLDVSKGMIEYARKVEREDPLGIEYVVQDAAAAGKLGTFDIVTATYLLHYASSKEQMHAMCATLRSALAPGGLLASICMSPGIQLTQPEYYRRYGLEVQGGVQDGDEALLISTSPGAEFTITVYHWKKATYEAALQAAGFRDIVWFKPEIAPEGMTTLGEEYWQAYLQHPHADVFTCRAA
ncbi:MAG TPA: class I SAM-dependent methyltransferase [Hyalangium sp.]|nr:class I SAM-dependent methyltransferase [Hyalangium sp.]